MFFWWQVDDDRKARDQVDRVFRKLDLNQDGVITIEEFIESCLKVSYHSYRDIKLSPSPTKTCQNFS